MHVNAFDQPAAPTRARKLGVSEGGQCVGRSNALVISEFRATTPVAADRSPRSKVIAMLDFAMIAAGVGFFVASVLYVLACERM